MPGQNKRVDLGRISLKYSQRRNTPKQDVCIPQAKGSREWQRTLQECLKEQAACFIQITFIKCNGGGKSSIEQKKKRKKKTPPHPEAC